LNAKIIALGGFRVTVSGKEQTRAICSLLLLWSLWDSHHYIFNSTTSIVDVGFKVALHLYQIINAKDVKRLCTGLMACSMP
jgi:hypothetical protein